MITVSKTKGGKIKVVMSPDDARLFKQALVCTQYGMEQPLYCLLFNLTLEIMEKHLQKLTFLQSETTITLSVSQAIAFYLIHSDNEIQEMQYIAMQIHKLLS